MRAAIGLVCLMAAIPAAAFSQAAPNPFDRFDPPVVGPWEKYGGRPSGTELKPAMIPPQFRGEWNDPLRACGTGLSDMRLRIGSKVVRFYESDGEVRRVIRHNTRAIAV